MVKRRSVSPKRRSAAIEVSGVVAEATRKQREAGKAPVVGSALLRSLLGRVEPVKVVVRAPDRVQAALKVLADYAEGGA